VRNPPAHRRERENKTRNSPSNTASAPQMPSCNAELRGRSIVVVRCDPRRDARGTVPSAKPTLRPATANRSYDFTARRPHQIPQPDPQHTGLNTAQTISVAGPSATESESRRANIPKIAVHSSSRLNRSASGTHSRRTAVRSTKNHE